MVRMILMLLKCGILITHELLQKMLLCLKHPFIPTDANIKFLVHVWHVVVLILPSWFFLSIYNVDSSRKLDDDVYAI